jgi:hypothetical protein
MPRYGVGTYLNPQENDKLKKACEVSGQSKYKFIREAILKQSDEVLKNERGKEGKRETSGTNGQVRDESEDID